MNDSLIIHYSSEIYGEQNNFKYFSNLIYCQ